jgi:hypothetical protein
MTFPTGNQVDTTDLAAGSGNPATARAQLYFLATWFNQLVDSQNAASGVCVLDNNARITAEQLPASIEPTGILTLAPTTGFVKVEDILRLQIIDKTTLLATENTVLGDLALAADDQSGTNAKLCMYNGTVWKIIATLSTATTLT